LRELSDALHLVEHDDGGNLALQQAQWRACGHRFQGNKYYRSKKIIPAGANSAFAGRERRWVIYNGNNDSSVPAEWHGWLHNSYDGVPESHLPPPRIWEAEYTPTRPAPPRRITRPGRWPQAVIVRPRRAITKPGRPTPDRKQGTAPMRFPVSRSRSVPFACDAGPERVSGPEQCAEQFGQGCCPSRRQTGGRVENQYGTPVKDRVATLGIINKRNNLTQHCPQIGRAAHGGQCGGQAGHLRKDRAMGAPAGSGRLRAGLRAGTLKRVGPAGLAQGVLGLALQEQPLAQCGRASGL
jgi:NADH:ubiquinone oxidoreductase subunit